MNPQVEILSAIQIDWPSFKATLDKALNERPDRILAQYPVPIKEDAEYLLYIASLVGIPIHNPLDTLRNLPHNLLDFLHYTMLIACGELTYKEFLSCTRLNIVAKQVDLAHILLVAGPMTMWYDTVIFNLSKDWKYSVDTRILIDKILLTFEKRGLKELFANFNRKPLKDGTFLLEHKK